MKLRIWFKEKFYIFILFLLINFILTLTLSFSYVFISKRTLIEFLFLIFALFSNTFMIYFALFLISSLFLFLPFFQYLLISLFSIYHMAFVIDIILYRFWGFHINSMVINLLTTPGGIDTLNQSWNVKLYFWMIFLGLILAEYFIFRFSVMICQKNNFLKFLKRAVLFLFFCVFIDKFSFAISNLYDYTPVIKNRDLFPLYQPLTIRSFANKYLGFNLNKPVEKFIDSSYSNLIYPKSEIRLKKTDRDYNFLIIVADSMRYDMLDEEVVPNIFELSKKSIVFKNHYSGGNATRFGIFSIFYGLYGNYWFNMVGEKRAPVMMEALRKKGYDMRVFASSKVTFPEFNKTCFVNIPDGNIFDEPKKGNGAQRDFEVTEKFIDYIQKREKNNPFFGFIFFDAPHGSYDYFPEFEKFKPSYGVNLLRLNKENVKPLFNKYKNSIHFDDFLIGKILKLLKEKKYLKDTIIIITADHGEPFLERGYFGHNHSYSKEEVSVPFVFYHPDLKPQALEHKTSHFDIVPTIMEIIGAENPKYDYSHGFGLFEKNKWKYIPVFSWNDCAIIFDDYSYVLPLTSYGGRIKKIRNEDWQEVEFKKEEIPPLIVNFNKDLTRFLKR
ncbi:MAG: sulfatase-like hydrolase/transferase [Elusimicrobiota bacterium]